MVKQMKIQEALEWLTANMTYALSCPGNEIRWKMKPPGNSYQVIVLGRTDASVSGIVSVPTDECLLRHPTFQLNLLPGKCA